MKAMILAAGKGERMRPLTLNTPKPLLDVGGETLIGHHIRRLVAAGFADIVINHSWLGEQIEQSLGDGRRYGARITYSPEAEPLETAGGIRQALPSLIQDGDWFLVINGDVWSEMPLSRLKVPDNADCSALLVLAPNPEHHPDGDFLLTESGRVENDDQRHSGERLTFAGISLLHQRLFSSLEKGVQRLAPVLHSAIARGEVRAIRHEGFWLDVGTPQRLAQLRERVGGEVADR